MLRMKRASGATLSNNPNQSVRDASGALLDSTTRSNLLADKQHATHHPTIHNARRIWPTRNLPAACLSFWLGMRPFTAASIHSWGWSSCPAPHNSGGARVCRPVVFVPASAPRVCVALRARRGRHRARRRPPPSPAGWPPARRASRATCPNGSRPRGRHCRGSYDPRECLAIPP